MSSEHRYPYHINIFYDPDDGDYIADVPDKYVSPFGDTPEEALREVLIALELETCRRATLLRSKL